MASSAGGVSRISVLASLLVIGILGCARPAQLRYEEELEQAPAAGRHAIHSERLQQHMRGLERLAVERLPRAMEEGEAEGWRRTEIVEVARAMASSAVLVAEAADTLGLDAADRDRFVALAEELRRRALRLAEQAPHSTVQEMRGQLRTLETTCDRCHGRFRIRRDSDAG